MSAPKNASCVIDPEAPLTAVARGDFSGLSCPILVAAPSTQVVEEFREQYALASCEVRRYRRNFPYEWAPREDKILLLLPGWSNDPKTRAAVAAWVNQDRYTVEFEAAASPPDRRAGLWIVFALSAAVWGAVVWFFTR
jgi:hypothetical protein